MIYNKGWLKPLKTSSDKDELIEKASLLPEGTDWLVARSIEMGSTRGESDADSIRVSKPGKPNTRIVNRFVSDLGSAKQNYPDRYWSVDQVMKREAIDSTVIINDHGGVMVDKCGTIKGLFKKPQSTRRGASSILVPAAIKNGGVKLDCFDGYIAAIYESHGFRVVSRMRFDEEYAPEGWNKDKHGTPGVVAMIYDPGRKMRVVIKVFTDYNEAILYRDSYLDLLEKQ